MRQNEKNRHKNRACINGPLWRRWAKEYMTALRDTHNLNHSSKFEVSKGDVVLVRTDGKNRGKWSLAIVRATYPGRDHGVVRGVQVETSKGLLERPVQHLCPLELACDKVPLKEQPLNPQAVEFLPKHAAAISASKNIKLILEQEQKLL